MRIVRRLCASSLAAALLVGCGTATFDGGSGDAGAVDAGACPDVTGSYSLANSGPGCGDLANAVPQCIVAAGASCSSSFKSATPNGRAALGINGEVALTSDGAFSGASLTEGTIARSGCTGSWDAQSSTMTVMCGGATGTQACVVMLTRSGATCP